MLNNCFGNEPVALEALTMALKTIPESYVANGWDGGVVVLPTVLQGMGCRVPAFLGRCLPIQLAMCTGSAARPHSTHRMAAPMWELHWGADGHDPAVR